MGDQLLTGVKAILIQDSRLSLLFPLLTGMREVFCSQVMRKTLLRALRPQLQRSWFLEEMGGPHDEFKPFLPFQQVTGLTIELADLRITCANHLQCSSVHTRQSRTRSGRT